MKRLLPRRFRLGLSLAWLLGVGTMVAYLLIRPNPSASDMPLPSSWIRWLNWAHDARTMALAMAYAGPAALLLADTRLWRWVLMSLALGILLAGETAQLWIPSRSFSWIDVAYSCLGVGMVEWMASRYPQPAGVS